MYADLIGDCENQKIKNFQDNKVKSFLVGLIFTILLLMEDEYSEFYSVAPDRELSSIVKQEIEKTIQESPAISKYFKLVKSEIRCELKKSKMIALATSNNRMDGKQLIQKIFLPSLNRAKSEEFSSR